MDKSFTFAKDRRLLKPADYKAVFDEQTLRLHQSHLLCFIKQAAPTQNTSRLGLAITKKKVKRAHERNRIKRLARECFRHHTDDKRFDMVVTVKQPTDDLSNQEITQQFANIFRLIAQRL